MITESVYSETDRIVHYLMLNTSFMPNIGLLHGQMGVISVLSEYSRYTNNELYFEVASYLLDNIMENVNENFTYSFDSGLSGIGWGIEYLIQHGFVEGESIDICEEIDQKIMETDPSRITDISLDTGFKGLLHYIIYHLQGAINQDTKLPFDDRYLSDINAVCLHIKAQEKNVSINYLLDIYTNFYISRVIKGYNTAVIDFITIEATDLSDAITSYPLGLKDGLAGKLLKHIFDE